MARSKGVARTEGRGDTVTRVDGENGFNTDVSFDDMPAELRKVLDGKQKDVHELSLDDIFELLKNRRRREVIDYLRRSDDGKATLDELAEYIAARENDIEIAQLSSDQRKRVYIGLYQCHLPKMDELGIVEFEKNRGTIQLLDTVSQLEPYIDRVDSKTTDSPPTVEIAVTGLVILLLGPAAVGIGPMATLPAIAWAAISTTALIGIAFYRVTQSV